MEYIWCSNVHTDDDDFHSNSLLKESTTTATLVIPSEIHHETNLLAMLQDAKWPGADPVPIEYGQAVFIWLPYN